MTDPTPYAEAAERVRADIEETCPPGSKSVYALARHDDLRTLLAANQAQAEELKALREAAACARIKLSRYMEQHPGTWVGGVQAEYQAAIARIDAALLHQGDAK